VNSARITHDGLNGTLIDIIMNSKKAILGVMGIGVLISILPMRCSAEDTNAASPNLEGANSATATPGIFSKWLAMVAKSQAEQPHWASPMGIVSPCLQQLFRYDISQQSLKGGRTLTIFGSGKGLEFIAADRLQFIIGVPPWETENTTPSKDGWGDESFLMKFRLAAANEQEGNYVVTAFMGMTVPNGGENYSLGHYTFTPTLAFGKGWGNFDFQSTMNTTFPDNGAAHGGMGTPLAINGVWQYRLAKVFWPEVEVNYTWWPNGTHEGLNQVFITPGLVLGRFPIWKRFAAIVGAGCQVAVTDHPLVHRNIILSTRITF
jgi:hypothetical protein